MKGKILLCFLAISYFCVAQAWLPRDQKIRGVNFGGLFIVEPWMMGDEWRSMGCQDYASEFDCVKGLGQAAANAAFQKHWASWITEADITQIKSLGLNTIRIPLGYWINEDLVWEGEYWPQGGFAYLENLCRHATYAGLYIILDLHAAPGAQKPWEAFTGQMAPTAEFYKDHNFERAIQFMEWLTNLAHTNPNFANVGALQLVNEPLQNHDTVQTMLHSYYPNAWRRIRGMEDNLGVIPSNRLHIMMMNGLWGSGDPNEGLQGIDLGYSLYDDHHYVKWTASVPANRNAYMQHSCTNDRGGNSPTIVGEWSLSTADEDGSEFDIKKGDAVAWYRRWWAAQVLSYEKQMGWIFWTWKVNWINGHLEWRWGYQQAYEAGVIPKNPQDAYSYGVCNGIS
ncbi:hypothetical protein R1flu_011492 [Riccia fluitans]|uniref:glucan 1,3-beta-glucosidase n=1 Tax=Riccia fluitans TaxID=41844 RepID=A0ABD1Z7Y8_9MARC